MAGITNSYLAEPKFFVLCQIIKRTKRGKVKLQSAKFTPFGDRKFASQISAKIYIENKYELALRHVHTNHGFEVVEKGRWKDNIFTVSIKKKNKGGDKTLNSIYELSFTLHDYKKDFNLHNRLRRLFRG